MGDGAWSFSMIPEALGRTRARKSVRPSTSRSGHSALRDRGIHSGPVNQAIDVNDRFNIAGAGIDIAQRVMDCGDAGHILSCQSASPTTSCL